MTDAALKKKIDALSAKGTSFEHYNALPHVIATKFGARGYELYDEPTDGERYFDLSALPKDCPFAKTLTVQRVWKPIAEHCPQLVAALTKHTKLLIVMHRPRGDDPGWYLGYFLDRGPKAETRYRRFWGRAPNDSPRLNNAAAGFKLPASLRAFYAVHDGLGLSAARVSGVEAVLSADNLRPLEGRRGLLELYCDSGGNRKAIPKSGEDRLVDWDRSTHEVAIEGAVWSLLEGEVLRYAVE